MASIAAGRRIIDVHVHVIREGESEREGNVSQARIDSQLAVLNRAYSESGFEFRLASVDRVTNPGWYRNAEGARPEVREMKSALRVGDADDLNLYLNFGRSGLPGQATFPWEYAGDPIRDGIVLHQATLPGGSYPNQDEGDVAVHEVGHWMGLHHTFDQKELPDGDLVDDTPAHLRPDGLRPAPGSDSRLDAPGVDPVHNYMNYVADDWMHEFTPGQIRRMQEQFAAFREE